MFLKTGFYNNFDISVSDIDTEIDTEVNMYDMVETDIKRNINVGENSNLVYKLACFNDVKFEIDINFISNGGTAKIDILLLSKNGKKVDGDINVNIKGDNCSADINIISLIGNDGINHANGNIFIETGSKKAKGHLMEQSIYLFERGQSILLPKLFIGTNDVEASHGAKIERLDNNKLFYIMSKGINKDLSKKLMVSGYLNMFFDKLENSEEYKENFINYLLGNE